MKMSTKRGNCIRAKKAIGILAKQTDRITIHNSSWNIMERPAQKATIMAAMDRKRVERPIINFFGKDSRKSSSAYLDVRIPRNISTEVVEVNSAMAFDSIKTLNNFLFINIGKPVF